MSKQFQTKMTPEQRRTPMENWGLIQKYIELRHGIYRDVRTLQRKDKEIPLKRYYKIFRVFATPIEIDKWVKKVFFV